MATNNADNISSTGFISYDGAGVFAGRTLSPSADNTIFITNGTGVSGDPTFQVEVNNLTNIPNSALQNSSITINTSGTLTGGGTVSLGGTLNISDDLSGFVPYTGATASVDLGAHDLSAENLTATTGNINLVPSGAWTPGTNGIVFMNSNRWIHSTGSGANTFFGQAAGNLSTTGSFHNTGIGEGTLQNLSFNAANYNTAIGSYSQNAAQIGGYNTTVGVNSLLSSSSGQYNTCVGAYSLQSINSSENTALGFDAMELCGTRNIAIGFVAGGSYTGDENYNILLGHSGVAHESNQMHLGTQGTGTGQIDKTTIAGQITTTSGRIVNTTAPGAYPYTTLYTDYVIWVDTASARTINLLASPETGRTFRIKDITGSAAANNITITPAAGNIDGAGSFVINVNYGSVDVVYNGTSWSVL